MKLTGIIALAAVAATAAAISIVGTVTAPSYEPTASAASSIGPLHVDAKWPKNKDDTPANPCAQNAKKYDGTGW